jgi:hypothetical protein
MLMADCARCGISFIQRRSDHRFCSPECRKLGERKPGDRVPADPVLVARLFDASRDPEALCREDEWHPGGPGWAEVDACVDTVAGRRAWFLELQRQGRL